MARKTTQTPVHDSLKIYTEKVTKLAFKRGTLTEQKRLNNWIVKKLETTQDPVELNLLKQFADVINE